MKIAYLISFLVLILSHGAEASNNQHCDDLIEKEIGNILSNNDISYLYIDIFGGNLPVPNRYSINNEGSKFLSLMSPVQLNKSNYKNICLIGNIRAGKYSNEIHSIFKHYEFEEKLNYLNFRILINPTNNSDPDFTIKHDVLIHDGKEFITMSDTNKQLWKILFNKLLANKGIKEIDWNSNKTIKH
ncbi:MAG: hypothetical protein JAZ06_05695 [Candidatus Thiodiazotropha taylori]|nr:hypothetical protein [Candidatus Thiodiazotropha taylori]